MKLIKPKFWINKNLLSYFFYPLTIITYLFNLIKEISTKKKFKIKTICVGNIFIGGTGKTSLTIKIADIFQKKTKFVFIKKNYLNQIDEINLLKKKGPIISTNNRLKSLEIAEKKGFQIALLDDGLQQKNIKYDIKIVCFNTEVGIGNGLIFPAGPLRENLSQLKNYDIAFLNGEKKNNKIRNIIKSYNKNIEIFKASYKPTNLNKINLKKKYLFFCGIGNPQEFENTLLKYKFKIKRKIIYADHYQIPNQDIKEIKQIAKKEKLNIITTEKDYFRLRRTQRKGVDVLKVKLKIDNLNKLKKILLNTNEKN